MSLIDCEFSIKHLSKILICQIISSLKIRKIKTKMHKSSDYVIMELLFSKVIKKGSTITCLTTEFHLINNFKINILIDMNVIKSKDIVLNCDKRFMIISTCDDIKVFISVQKKKVSVDCAV